MWSCSFKVLCIIEIIFAGSFVDVSTASTDGNGSSKKETCKKLKFAVRLNQDNREISSVVGYDVKFDCRVIGTPEPNITWTKDDIPLKDISYRSFGPAGLEKVFVLNLKNILVADSGRYRCTADNGECKAISTSLKLIIKETSRREIPKIKELVPINPQIIVGGSVKFFCSVHSFVDFVPFIKWVKYRTYKLQTDPPAVQNNTNITRTPQLPTGITPENEQTLNVSRLANTKYIVDGMVHETIDLKIEKCLRSELVISSSSFSDSAEYSCVAFNEIGFDKVTSRLNVKPVPPLSKEELKRIYIRKYGTPVKLPFSLAAIVVIPVCLLIILIIGCVWWHSNEQRLEEERLKHDKQKYVECPKVEEKKVQPGMIPIVSIQSTTSDSADTSYNFIKRTKANSDAGVHTPVTPRKSQQKEASIPSLSKPTMHTPVAPKKSQQRETSIPSLSKPTTRSPNVNESNDKAKLLVEDRYSYVLPKEEKENADEINDPLT